MRSWVSIFGLKINKKKRRKINRKYDFDTVPGSKIISKNNEVVLYFNSIFNEKFNLKINIAFDYIFIIYKNNKIQSILLFSLLFL